MKKIAFATAILLTLFVCLTACASGSDTNNSTTQQNVQNNIAANTAQRFDKAVPYPYANNTPTDPLERENLARRLQQQNSAGSTAYVYLFTYSGQVLGYYVIKGKVSSTGSQMTSTQVMVQCGGGNSNWAQCPIDAIGDDGSYGMEEGGQNGVFFYTSAGTLVETNQPWISSTTPIPVYASAPQLDAKAH